ncbi:MAG: GtrA family protein [Oscillospiraceae bacterium]
MKEKIEKLWNSSVVRFIIVGVINTLVGSAIMFGLYNLAHCSYWLSSAANYTLTSILSFFLNKYFTFRDREKSVAQTLRFVLNIALCYGIAYGLAQPAVNLLLAAATPVMRDNVAMLTGMVLCTCCNYVGQRFFAFRKKQSSPRVP